MREAQHPRSRRSPEKLAVAETYRGILKMQWTPRSAVSRAQGEFPEAVLPLPAALGSFDCVAVRSAHGNSAQDDSVNRL